MHPVATIGYEGVTIDDLVATLRASGVDLLIDVRAVPLSRKPGFSKNKLATRLESEGIRYVGLRGLGTPPPGREAARKGRIAEMRKIFAEHLETDDASAELETAARMARDNHACLLCYEHDHTTCHRDVIVQRVAGINRQPVRHLDPYVGKLL